MTIEEVEALISRHKVDYKKQELAELAEKIMLAGIESKQYLVYDQSVISDSFRLAKMFIEYKEKTLSDNL